MMGLCDDGIRKVMQNKTEKHPVVKYYQVVECVCHFEHVVPLPQQRNCLVCIRTPMQLSTASLLGTCCQWTNQVSS